MGERDMKFCRLPEAWGDWQICGLAGEGACGSVYRAVNGKGEVSAVKVMDVPAGAFEVEALMRLKGCPYIVEAEDYFVQETGEGRWKVFLRMEYLKSLTELLHERTLGEEEALDMMIGLCRALEKCGQEQIIHRDIKPENILITKEGRVKLADFGIAGDPAETDRSRAIQGTFSYMAPEIFHGKRYDRTADIYSLGMVFYRIMNRGREPFVSVEKQIVGYKDREAALQERMDGAALPAPAAASPELARILQKACKFRPQQRYQSAAELRRALERCRRNRRNRLLRRIGGWSPGRRAAAAAALIVLVCAAGVGIWWRIPVMNVKDSGEGISFRLSRGGTLTVEAEGDLTGAWLPEDCADWCDQVKKLVIRGGNIKKLEGSFSTWNSLESVVLPEGIESMESLSFCFCSRLRRVVFPSALKTIGMGAFQSCKALESIVLPKGLETISDMAFSNCPKLARIEIPASVKEIGSGVFTETAWLEAQRASGDMVVVNDILVAYLGEEEEVEISEDSGIRCIAGSAFGYNTALRKVTMDDTVEELGKGVFNGCFSLASVRLSSNLKELPEQTFGNCTSLEEIVLPEGIERIGRYAFRECESLKAISIPESVTCIEEEVFTGTALYNEQAAGGDYIVLKDFLIKCLIDEHEIVIPEDLGIRRIADFAFERKERLTKVTIPEGIVSLGEGCFFFCRNLETIEFPESLTEIGWGAMAATKWMENLNEAGGPYVVNGIDISY